MDPEEQNNEQTENQSTSSPQELRRPSLNLSKSIFRRTKTDLLRNTIVTETNRFSKEKKVIKRSRSRPSQDNSDEEISQEPSDTPEQKDGAKSGEISGTDSDENESSGAEYDTDLELDERTQTPQDRWGIRTYNRTCHRLGLNPVSSIQRGLKSSSIQVRNRSIDKKDGLALAYALLENAAVEWLVLDENCLGHIGTEYIALMLYENASIRVLNLSSNNIGSLGTRAILEMLLQNNIITRLELAGNNLTDTEAYMFAEYLEESKILRYLNLSGNDFGDEAGLVLGPALGVNNSLKGLDLSWNKIRTKGGMAICRGMEVNTSITSLNLAYNGLSTPGAYSMAHTLKVNETLIDVDLTCNRIFDEGAGYLGKGLSHNQTLKYFRIANNPLTTHSAITLLDVLKSNANCALELLDMSSIHIYKNALSVVSEIKQIRPSFRFQYAGIVRSDDTIGAEDDAIIRKNPLTILKEYIHSKNLRLVDLFKQFDKDGGGSISREEFVRGLRSIEVPLTQAQLDQLIDMLDKDGDGEVDYGELVAGDKEHRRKMMKVKQKALVTMTTAPKKKEEPKSKILNKHS